MKNWGLLLLPLVVGQKVGKMKKNDNPKLPMEECTGSENCSKKSTTVTMDQNWRWLHADGEAKNCYEGNLWDNTLCPDPATCTENCVIEGIPSNEWQGTYGVSTSGDAMTLKFVTHGPYSTNVGSRTFLLDGDEYYMFKLLNREFTFDVDVSELPCGLNGALYFVEMEADGGLGSYPSNEAGAAYGTGYCDAQCPHDIKFINGEANNMDWNPSDTDINAGTGHYGSCCVELDIWEANSISSAFTPHPCELDGPKRCEGLECGDNKSGDRYNGVCDKDGCDFHNWRLGDKTFFGPGSNFKVDSTKPMTVVTQFLTDDGTDNGDFVEMRRIYLQDGKIIDNSFTNIDGITRTDSVNDKMCSESKVAFEDEDDFGRKGGMKKMSESMARGMVLVMSLWDDHDAHMLWLDSNYPVDADPNKPGVDRGSCPTSSGEPSDVESNFPNSKVKFSKIRFGTLGSTYPGGIPPTTTEGGPTTTANSNCPGGNLNHCVALCPDAPPAVHDGCVQECNSLCA